MAEHEGGYRDAAARAGNRAGLLHDARTLAAEAIRARNAVAAEQRALLEERHRALRLRCDAYLDETLPARICKRAEEGNWAIVLQLRHMPEYPNDQADHVRRASVSAWARREKISLRWESNTEAELSWGPSTEGVTPGEAHCGWLTRLAGFFDGIYKPKGFWELTPVFFTVACSALMFLTIWAILRVAHVFQN